MENVTTISMSAKCSDMCDMQLLAADGALLGGHHGYVPTWLSPEGFGDYVQLDIDRDTGQILNWKRPTDADLARKDN